MSASRPAIAALLIALLLSTFATVIPEVTAVGNSSNASASSPPASGGRVFDVKSVETGCKGGASPCWDITLLQANPGDTVTIDANMASGFHNIDVKEPIAKKSGDPGAASGSVTFTLPATFAAPIKYVCDVHPTMTGQIVPPGFTAGGGGAGPVNIPDEGVKFLSYWVGVIAFAAMFVMYGATFFLFKYNESGFTTDHRDRPAAALAGGAGHAVAEPSGDAVTIGLGIVILLLLLSIVAVAFGVIKV